MRILMDTHIAIWAISDSPKLSDIARDILVDEDNEVYYSTVSVWEIIIKNMIRPDKVEIDGAEFAKACEATGFKVLPIINKHAFTVKTLERLSDAPSHHVPFDRMLIAQAKAEDLMLMTHDSLLPYYNEEYFICLSFYVIKCIVCIA